MALAEKMDEVATPEALVAMLKVVRPPEKVPLAPLPGAVKSTVAPETKLLLASRTVAVKGEAKGVLTVAVWPEPVVAVIEAAAPAVLVMAKFTDPAPVAEAAML